MSEFKSIYKSIKHRRFNTWCNYTSRLDPYGCGCVHDCSYCYAKGLLNFRGLWDSKNPKKSTLLNIAKTIKRLNRNEVIKIGGMTDCFQPIEATEKLTYNAIKLLNYYKIHYLIVTKNDLVSNNKYLDIYDKKLAHFQITITNTNCSDALKYEKAPKSSNMIKAIEKLYAYGFDVSVRLSPFIEGFIDYDILNHIKCNKILVEFLKVNHFTKKTFKINYDDYVVSYGGYRHLPLYKKLILIKNITGFEQISVGEYVSDHHLYFQKNINYNKNDCCNLNIKKKNIPIYKQLSFI